MWDRGRSPAALPVEQLEDRLLHAEAADADRQLDSSATARTKAPKRSAPKSRPATNRNSSRAAKPAGEAQGGRLRAAHDQRAGVGCASSWAAAVHCGRSSVAAGTCATIHCQAGAEMAKSRPCRPSIATTAGRGGVFRSPLFNASETFVRAQAPALPRYRPLVVGLERQGKSWPRSRIAAGRDRRSGWPQAARPGRAGRGALCRRAAADPRPFRHGRAARFAARRARSACR